MAGRGSPTIAFLLGLVSGFVSASRSGRGALYLSPESRMCECLGATASRHGVRAFVEVSFRRGCFGISTGALGAASIMCGYCIRPCEAGRSPVMWLGMAAHGGFGHIVGFGAGWDCFFIVGIPCGSLAGLGLRSEIGGMAQFTLKARGGRPPRPNAEKCAYVEYGPGICLAQ